LCSLRNVETKNLPILPVNMMWMILEMILLSDVGPQGPGTGSQGGAVPPAYSEKSNQVWKRFSYV